MSSRTNNWKYEWKGPNGNSVQNCRAAFFEAIQDFRPQAINDLCLIALPSFIEFLARRFKKYLPDAPSDSPSLTESIQRMKSIPEIETRVIIGWWTLQQMKGGKDICGRLRSWGKTQNLDFDWCYDHAIRTLRCWIFNEQIIWAGARNVYAGEPHPGEATGSSIMVLGWGQAIEEMKVDLFWSRFNLSLEVFGDDKGDFSKYCAGKPRPFSVEFEDLPFFSYDPKALGWNYLQGDKNEWQARIERDYDRFVVDLIKTGRKVPEKGKLKLRREIAHYLKACEIEEQAAVKEHGLVSKSCPGGRMEWLVRYQVRPTEKLADIKGSGGGISSNAIGKQIKKLASFIGLTPRNPRVDAGRPLGSKNKHIGSAGRSGR